MNRNRLATALPFVALALTVFTPSVSVADEVTDWNQNPDQRTHGHRHLPAEFRANRRHH